MEVNAKFPSLARIVLLNALQEHLLPRVLHVQVISMPVGEAVSQLLELPIVKRIRSMQTLAQFV